MRALGRLKQKATRMVQADRTLAQLLVLSELHALLWKLKGRAKDALRAANEQTRPPQRTAKGGARDPSRRNELLLREVPRLHEPLY